MKKTKIRYLVLIIGTLFFTSILTQTEVSAAEKVKFLRMVTSVPQGAWYPLGARLCQMMEEVEPGLSATVVPGGGVDNCKVVDKGQTSTVGWTYANSTAAAYAGQPPFKEAHKNLRHVATLFFNNLHIVVQKNSDAKEVPDLMRKRIAVGPKSFTWAVIIEDLFRVYGFDYAKVNKSGGVVNYVAGSQVDSMFKDGNIDAILNGVAGLPHPGFVDLNRAAGFNLLEVKGKHAAEIIEIVPGLVKTVIPKGTYSSVNRDIETIAAATVIMCNKDLPDEFVYKMTKLIWDRKPELVKVLSVMNDADISKALNGVKLPVHPGAIKYYKEKGVIK